MRKNGNGENIIKRLIKHTMYALKSIWRQMKRLFSWGHVRDEEWHNLEKKGVETPTKLLLQSFFRRKSAVFALCTLIGIFLFVFISPAFIKMDVNYTDPLQQNVAPSYTLRKVPMGLKNKVASIDGFSDFTVGLSTDGKVYVWGNTKNKLQKIDFGKVPTQVKEEGAAFVAAGKDHIIAVTKDGQIVGWGDRSCGQYGTENVLNAISMPTALADGVRVEEIAGLSCGYQASALVMRDGTLHVWGNKNTVRNLVNFTPKNGEINMETQAVKRRRLPILRLLL